MSFGIIKAIHDTSGTSDGTDIRMRALEQEKEYKQSNGDGEANSGVKQLQVQSVLKNTIGVKICKG